jgi:IPT/TIG domain.
MVMMAMFGFYFSSAWPADGRKGSPKESSGNPTSSNLGSEGGKSVTPSDLPPKPAIGHIGIVYPNSAKPGEGVVIGGIGFGKEKGNVEFGYVAVQSSDIDDWTDSYIKVKIPPNVTQGTVEVSVTPTVGNKITGGNLTVDDRGFLRLSGTGASFLLLLLYVILLVVFISLIHILDSNRAYRASQKAREEVKAKLPATLLPDQVSGVMEGLTRTVGIAGTTRAILTYTLFIVLGISVFHLLVFSPFNDAGKLAENILMGLAGSLASIIGFYFGSKATQEGVDSGKTAPETQPKLSVGHIDSVDPNSAKVGEEVTIRGSGFGNVGGNVGFKGQQAQPAPADIVEWKDDHIKVKIPSGTPQGTVEIAVNPKVGNEIIGGKLIIAQ